MVVCYIHVPSKWPVFSSGVCQRCSVPSYVLHIVISTGSGGEESARGRGALRSSIPLNIFRQFLRQVGLHIFGYNQFLDSSCTCRADLKGFFIFIWVYYYYYFNLLLSFFFFFFFGSGTVVRVISFSVYRTCIAR